MREFEKMDVRDIGAALLFDAAALPPFLGNAVRVILADDLEVDYFDPKDTNDQLWVAGTIASFIPVATIIAVKEMVKQKRRGD